MFLCIGYVWPSRPIPKHRKFEWLTNFSLGAIASIILRAAPLLLAVSVAHYAEANRLGVLNTSLFSDLSLSRYILEIALFDFAIYWQHRLFHKSSKLWLLHRVHHSDRHLDASSALRFHPFEIVISMIIKSALVIIFGISPVSVIIFEVLLNVSAIFNHANFDFPTRWDNMLRHIFVTPTMHRIHHSILRSDCDSNYGFFLSIWDRLFRTYHKESITGLGQFELGAKDVPKHWSFGLGRLLTQPFYTKFKD